MGLCVCEAPRGPQTLTADAFQVLADSPLYTPVLLNGGKYKKVVVTQPKNECLRSMLAEL